MNAVNDEVKALATTGMRASATWFIDQKTLPGHATVKAFDNEFRETLAQLIRQIEQRAAERPADDVHAKAALAGVGEARRRLGLEERPGLVGENERVTKLARSVVALCDHLDALTGIRTCLACNKKIEDGDTTVPHDMVSPSGGAVRYGQVHASCANAARR